MITLDVPLQKDDHDGIPSLQFEMFTQMRRRFLSSLDDKHSVGGQLGKLENHSCTGSSCSFLSINSIGVTKYVERMMASSERSSESSSVSGGKRRRVGGGEGISVGADDEEGIVHNLLIAQWRVNWHNSGASIQSSCI